MDDIKIIYSPSTDHINEPTDQSVPYSRYESARHDRIIERVTERLKRLWELNVLNASVFPDVQVNPSLSWEDAIIDGFSQSGNPLNNADIPAHVISVESYFRGGKEVLSGPVVMIEIEPEKRLQPARRYRIIRDAGLIPATPRVLFATLKCLAGASGTQPDVVKMGHSIDVCSPCLFRGNKSHPKWHYAIGVKVGYKLSPPNLLLERLVVSSPSVRLLYRLAPL